jgi:hypothetical protein
MEKGCSEDGGRGTSNKDLLKEEAWQPEERNFYGATVCARRGAGVIPATLHNSPVELELLFPLCRC